MADVGRTLEARYHRLMIKKGFCTFRGVLIQTYNNEKIATDIDLLAIKYNETLDKYLVNTECKSGNIEVFDRLFWLSGLNTFIKSNKSSLIVNKFTNEYIDFAKQLNIDLISTNEIDEIEKNLSITTNVWPGLSNFEIWDNCFIGIEKYSQVKGISDKLLSLFKEANQSSRYDIWSGFNYNTFNKSIRLIREIHKEAESFKSEIELMALCQLFISILLISLSHSIVYICHELIIRPKTERLDYLKTKLIFGEQDVEYMRRFISSMNKIIRSTLQRNNINDLFIDRIDINNSLKEPDFCEPFYKLLNILLGKTNFLVHLPYAIEITQFQSVNQNYSISKVNEGNQIFELLKAFLVQEFSIQKEFFLPPNTSIIKDITNKYKKKN